MAVDMLLAQPSLMHARTLPQALSSHPVLVAQVCRVMGAVCLLIATGCPHAPLPPGNLPLVTTTDRQAEADLRHARELQQAGELDEAIQAYQTFLRDHPTDPLTAVARIALAQIHLADDDGASAKLVLEPVVDHPDAAVRERARFYRGLAVGKLGDHSGAIASLSPLVGHTIDPEETGLLLQALMEAYFASGALLEGLRIVDRMAVDAVPEGVRSRAMEQLRTTVAAADSAHIASAFAELDRSGAAWPLVAERALLQADASQDATRAREILAAMSASDVELSDEAKEIAIRATRPAEADHQVVGAVLTLSGRTRALGEVALRGLMLAAGLPATGPRPADAPQLVFRDDGGDPARAVQAVDELVTVHRAIAIIGPMDGQAARAAAARAQELGVPMISLTPQPDINATGSLIFRLLATPEEEASALVGYAIEQGKRRFAILRPDNSYGSLMTTAYEAAITKHGGELLATASYAAAATSFGHEVSALAAHAFDVLLVADVARRLELIAPALAAGGLWSRPPQAAAPKSGRAILVMSPSVGFGPELARSVGRYLQGATFSVPFNAAVPSLDNGFVERFRRQFNSAPDSYAAFAHDAYRLVRNAVDHGARTRAEVAASLSRGSASETAGPSHGFNSERAPRTATRLVQLNGDTMGPAINAASP